MDDVSGWTQWLVNIGIGVGAFLAGLLGYSKRSRSQPDMHVAGALVTQRELEPLVEALKEVSDSINRRVRQWDEREVSERHEAEKDEMREELRALRKMLRRKGLDPNEEA